jgi:hypothetical protein
LEEALCSHAVTIQDEERRRLIEEGDAFRRLKIEETLVYDAEKYPFVECVLKMVNIDTDLNQWHTTIENFSPGTSVKKSKKDLAPLLNEAAQKNPVELSGGRGEVSFQEIYHTFVREVVIPHIEAEAPELLLSAKGEGGDEAKTSSELIIQTSPCIRLQPPSAYRMTCPHKDSSYGHQPGQVNFWVPLTPCFAENSLYAESAPGKKDFRPFDLRVGEMVRFYGNGCVHYTVPNRTEVTRVSMDFRVVPARIYDNDFIGSRRKLGRSGDVEEEGSSEQWYTQKFKLGGYYERILGVGGIRSGGVNAPQKRCGGVA